MLEESYIGDPILYNCNIRSSDELTYKLNKFYNIYPYKESLKFVETSRIRTFNYVINGYNTYLNEYIFDPAEDREKNININNPTIKIYLGDTIVITKVNISHNEQTSPSTINFNLSLSNYRYILTGKDSEKNIFTNEISHQGVSIVTIKILKGDTLQLDVSVSNSHPFIIKKSDYNPERDGKDNGKLQEIQYEGEYKNGEGLVNGTITWDTTDASIGRYYGICVHHIAMYFIIDILEREGVSTSILDVLKIKDNKNVDVVTEAYGLIRWTPRINGLYTYYGNFSSEETLNNINVLDETIQSYTYISGSRSGSSIEVSFIAYDMINLDIDTDDSIKILFHEKQEIDYVQLKDPSDNEIVLSGLTTLQIPIDLNEKITVYENKYDNVVYSNMNISTARTAYSIEGMNSNAIVSNGTNIVLVNPEYRGIDNFYSEMFLIYHVDDPVKQVLLHIKVTENDPIDSLPPTNISISDISLVGFTVDWVNTSNIITGGGDGSINVTNYEISYKNNRGEESRLEVSHLVSSYVFDTLPSGNSYEIIIRSKNDFTNIYGDWSLPVYAGVKPNKVLLSSLNAVSTSSNMLISWTDPIPGSDDTVLRLKVQIEDFTTYDYRSDVIEISYGVEQFEFLNLFENRYYNFSIYSFIIVNEQQQIDSEIVSKLFKTKIGVPNEPTILSYVSEENSITISLLHDIIYTGNNTTLIKYEYVLYERGIIIKQEKRGTNIDNILVITGLERETDYQIQIFAYNADNIRSLVSVDNLISTSIAPPETVFPRLSTVVVNNIYSDSELRAEWDHATLTRDRNYQVLLYLSSDSQTAILTSQTIQSTSYTFRELFPNTYYRVKVRTLNSEKESVSTFSNLVRTSIGVIPNSSIVTSVNIFRYTNIFAPKYLRITFLPFLSLNSNQYYKFEFYKTYQYSSDYKELLYSGETTDRIKHIDDPNNQLYRLLITNWNSYTTSGYVVKCKVYVSNGENNGEIYDNIVDIN